MSWIDDYRCKILVVDDTPANRVAFANVLAQLENVEIIYASSGEEALALLLRHHFSVVLLDVHMPGMDGYEVAKLISRTKAHQHIPIMMVTAYGSSTKDIVKAYECGAIDYITKPIEPLILLSKVKQFVALAELKAKSDYLKSEREMILEAAGQGVLKLDVHGVIQFANTQACQLMGAPAHDIIDTCFDLWFRPDSSSLANDECFFSMVYQQVLERGIHEIRDIKLSLNDVEGCSVELTATLIQGQVNSPMIVLFRDVTERLALESKLVHLANYDPLTQLANRAYYHDSLNRAIARSKRLKSTVVCLMLDLDHFKQINDTLGHDVGDLVLQEVASRLHTVLRENDIAARLGGDEFAIIIEDTSIEEAEVVAGKIVTMFDAPFLLEHKEIKIETSVGIACCQSGVPDNLTLSKWADIALYAAKSAGRNTFQRFCAAMSEQTELQASILEQLRYILENQLLDVHYQPQYDLLQGGLIGFEALARWPANEGKQAVSPGLFIPIAEQSQLIHDLGRQVLSKSCDLLQSWKGDELKAKLSISVNLSARQINAPDFLNWLDAILENYDFSPHLLIFEITETAMLDHGDSVGQTLDVLKSRGFGLALDDFGTGYSSLNYLQNFPFDQIKIDQSFVHRLGHSHKAWAVIEAIMTIASAFDMDVVAEGVEDFVQLSKVLALGCDKVQGYYFHRPLPLSELDDVMLATGIPCFSPQRLLRARGDFKLQ